jgi:hypothetical protein
MTNFDYTNRDFLSIRQDLLNRAARTIPEWTSTDASDFGNVFVDLWAYMGDIIHFYIDRAAGEAFLQTATQRESIMAIANLLDYIPVSARAARGSVTVQLNALPALASSYVVPQYTVLTGYDDNLNGYSFYTTQASTALTSTTVGGSGNQVSIPVVQGQIIQNELLGDSTGRTDQRFSLVKKNADISSISVVVAEGPLDGSGNPTNVTYQYVAQMSTADYLDKVFTARVMSDNSTQIIFGNGFNGSIPTANATITATYRTTEGSAGNLSTNQIKTVSGSPSTYISVVSSTATSGGADAESIESIRNSVSRLYRTQDRAVSLQDYKDLCLQVPGVSKATAIHSAGGSFAITNSSVSSGFVSFTTTTAHNFVVGQTVTVTGVSQSSHNGTNLKVALTPSSTIFTVKTSDYGTTPTGSGTGGTATGVNEVILYPVPHQSDYPPSAVGTAPTQSVVIQIPTAVEEAVESYFSTRSMLGVTASVITQKDTISSSVKYIQCTPIYVRLKVNVLSNYVQSWVQDQVDKEVRALLAFDRVVFGQVVTIGDVYRAALSVVGVDYVEILTLNTSYSSSNTVGTVSNIQVDSTKLPCFSDDVNGVGPAVSFYMVGGLTGYDN